VISVNQVRYVLAVANFAVAALNAIAASESKEARDVLAAAAWVGSGMFWLWQAIVS